MGALEVFHGVVQVELGLFPEGLDLLDELVQFGGLLIDGPAGGDGRFGGGRRRARRAQYLGGQLLLRSHLRVHVLPCLVKRCRLVLQLVDDLSDRGLLGLGDLQASFQPRGLVLELADLNAVVLRLLAEIGSLLERIAGLGALELIYLRGCLFGIIRGAGPLLGQGLDLLLPLIQIILQLGNILLDGAEGWNDGRSMREPGGLVRGALGFGDLGGNGVAGGLGVELPISRGRASTGVNLFGELRDLPDRTGQLHLGPLNLVTDLVGALEFRLRQSRLCGGARSGGGGGVAGGLVELVMRLLGGVRPA